MMIYVHIPFCVRKCLYCDFLSFPLSASDTKRQPQSYSIASLQDGKIDKADYLDALIREIEGSHVNDVTSLFFGGGTPSLLTEKEITRVMHALKKQFSFMPDAEITIEANPGTVTKEKAVLWKSLGINRVSMGAQSMHDPMLQKLGRIHRSSDILESFQILREAGFTNLSLDLMFGLPGQTMEDWMDTLQQAVALQPEHLSCYSLIVEEGTYFFDHQDELDLPAEDVEREMYHQAIAFLKEHGYERYEISNFARPGYESRHNLGYWERVPYLGLGLGAASLLGSDGSIRFSNTTDFRTYIAKSAYPDEIHENMESLSVSDQMGETMFLGLRTARGVSKQHFYDQFGKSMEEVYGSVLTKHLSNGLLKDEAGYVYLTDLGVDLSNQVMADFLLDE